MPFRNPVNALPASRIIGQITGTQIANGSISTPKLTATAIDGMTITGALIRTAAAGRRVQADSTDYDRVQFFSGVAGETQAGYLLVSPFGDVMKLSAPTVTGLLVGSLTLTSHASNPTAQFGPGCNIITYKVSPSDSVNVNNGAFIADSTGAVTAASVVASALRNQTSIIVTSETTAGTTYVDLATVGPDITITAPPSGTVTVIWSCQASQNTAGLLACMGLDVFDVTAGASVSTASDNQAVIFMAAAVGSLGQQAMTCTYGVTPGHSIRFRGKYRTNGGTGTFSRRRLTVIPSL